jgi:putative PIN family toxin of toxin-antitoxin system
MNVVLDTNVWLSAFLFKGSCLRILSFSVSHFKIYRSDFLELELKEKLKNKFQLEDILLNELINRFQRITYYIAAETVVPDVCSDKDDNYILQICESCNADLLITGDKELLKLKTFQETQIISPSQFIDSFINNQ